MDAIQIELAVAAVILIAAPLITWGLGKVPQTRNWIRKYAVEGYNYLDKVKDQVPEAGMEAWQAAYDELDAVIDAFGDDEITAKELRHIAVHAFELVMAVKNMVV
jgi:hypothetical protein